MRKFIYIVTSLIVLFNSCTFEVDDKLAAEFAKPPSQTKPWVYWYWIDENISREGITKDLEAMARVGIGKALIGHVSPGEKRGPVRMLSDEWWDLVRFAVREGQQVGVDIGFFNGPGWSQSGGPWIKAEQSMRHVVSREISVKGPSVYTESMTYPDTLFQEIAIQAFRVPEPDVNDVTLKPVTVTSSPANVSIKNIVDGMPGTTFLFPEKISAGDSLVLSFEMKDSVTLQSIEINFLPVPFKAEISLEIPDSTGHFYIVSNMTVDRRNIQFEIGPKRFDPVILAVPTSFSAKFRLVLKKMIKDKGAGLRDINLMAGARIDHIIEKELGKMSSDPVPGWDTYLWKDQPEPSGGSLIHPDSIIDLSNRVDSAGYLIWDVPEGNWTILQSGMVPTGATNVPVPPEASGYECDKFSREAIETHFNSFIGKFLKMVPASERKSLKTVVIDSYEVGPQNWNSDLRAAFTNVYGYDPIPWLPVLSGRIVGSADQSNRFLWDLRRLSADLVANNYVDKLRELSNANGLQLWEENYGHWGFPAEFLQYGGKADQISGEFWFENPIWDLGPRECRGASSAAHIYGKTEVFAEAFTAGFNFRQFPAVMKTRGDQMFCEGINHFVLHVYIHQPWTDRVPGVTAWFGMSYNRNNTWFEQSRAWNNYLSRCHYLLQQGLPVSDLCYFTGEDAPKMTGILEPDVPPGYDYDLINADVIMNRLSVRNGELTLPDGKSYRMMILPPQQTMRPELLEKLDQLLRDGAIIYGPPPSRSPSLANYPASDSTIRRRTENIWGELSTSGEISRNIEDGRILNHVDLKRVFREINLEPDIICGDSSLRWTHRHSEGSDIYFLSNQSERRIQTEISFRVKDKIPEFWYPETGKHVQSTWFVSQGGRTSVPLGIEPTGSVFVVFRDPVDHPAILAIEKNGKNLTGFADDPTVTEYPLVLGSNVETITISTHTEGTYNLVFANVIEQEINVTGIPPDLDIAGPWNVYFENAGVKNDSLTLDKPESWTENDDPAIRYFSGTAVYRNSFEIPRSVTRSDLTMALNLGRVMVIAEVILNGRNLGVCWNKPFKVDITDAVRPGVNNLEIRVTNTWWNRLIGDAKYPRGIPGYMNDYRKTYTTTGSWTAEDELLPSGLLGPVKIQFGKIIAIRQTRMRENE